MPQNLIKHDNSLTITSSSSSTFASVHWHCWFGIRKSIRPVKNEDEVLAWLSVGGKVQMICIWSGWCHCHPINL